MLGKATGGPEEVEFIHGRLAGKMVIHAVKLDMDLPGRPAMSLLALFNTFQHFLVLFSTAFLYPASVLAFFARNFHAKKCSKHIY